MSFFQLLQAAIAIITAITPWLKNLPAAQAAFAQFVADIQGGDYAKAVNDFFAALRALVGSEHHAFLNEHQSRFLARGLQP